VILALISWFGGLRKREDMNVPEMGPVVSILMKPGVPTVEASSSILDVARMMKNKGMRNLFVVKDGKPIGVVRDWDVITNVVALHLDPAAIQARQVMYAPPPMVELNASLGDITKLMAETGGRRILVADKRGMYGTVTAGDVLNFVSGVPSKAYRDALKKISEGGA
jgi:CBS domain-containing protein